MIKRFIKLQLLIPNFGACLYFELPMPLVDLDIQPCVSWCVLVCPSEVAAKPTCNDELNVLYVWGCTKEYSS